MNRSDIRYRYALDEKGAVVDIFDLTENDRKDYICLGCERVLRPALGKIRKKHFRHKIIDNCSLETYLHRIGVWLFQETYQECLEKNQPFLLITPVTNICKACQDGPCCLIPTSNTYNLTQRYTHSVSEKRDFVDGDVFIPDVLLTNERDQRLYIEIVVSHNASQKKIDSDIPIIEININSEEDFDLIFEKKLSYENHRIRLINFKEKINVVDNSAECEILAARRRCEELDYQSKIIFKKAYEKAVQTGEPFLIGIKSPQECHACEGGPCIIGPKNVTFDLTKGFPVITEEHPAPGDTGIKLAIISKEGRKIYIESKQSFHIRGEDNKSCGDEIIEVNIHSSPSLDFFLNELKEPELFNIRHFFHNFKPKTIKKMNDPKNCTKEVTSFIVFSSGKAAIEKSSYFDVNNTKDSRKIYSKLIEDTDQEYYKMFIAEVEAAFIGRVRIKNCYLCRYHAGAKNFDSGQKGGIFCKVKKETNGSNKAADCEYYRPDAKVLGTERYPSYRNWW